MTVEFRGVDNLVYAEVLKDDEGGYEAAEPKLLAPTAEISKSVEQGSATKYYDNKPALVIASTGADTVTFTVSVLGLETLAEITGQFYDPDTGAMAEGEAEPRYFAVGYRLKKTDGSYRYVWRLKGRFAQPEESSATEDAGTDSKNQSLVYTGVSTEHRFAKGGARKSVMVDEGDGKADLEGFFSEVQTLLTIKPAT